jgi:predicted transposase YbfD/YdcC
MPTTREHPACDIASQFSALEDPREAKGKQHRLDEIMVIAICAVICGADGFSAIEEFGKAKEAWLRRFLTLKHGIPSHDTIGRVFARIAPEEFERCFLGWVRAACEATDGELVAIDGKTLRRSYDRRADKAALHMVSAWASERHMTLGQVRTEEESNEITAIPKLLEVLEVAGCIVSCDAMGCQKGVAAAIADQGADYVLALKRNQGELHADAVALFDRLEAPESCHESVGGDHGRVELRRCSAVEVAGRGVVDTEGWPGLRTVCRVESERHVDGEVQAETRYFISSLEADAKRLLEATRTHWHIENKLHWVLDVAFGEDQSRIRDGHAPQNMAVVRRLALNLLKQEETSSVGIKNRRLRAGWDEAYLLKVLRQA